VTVLRIPGDFGIVPPVDPDGKPRGSGRAGKGSVRGRPDVIKFSQGGKRLSADFAAKTTGTAGETGGLENMLRLKVEQRLASGYYERMDVLEVIADRVLEQFGI
jgi:hypothetical protein